jgi:hypothetical protein
MQQAFQNVNENGAQSRFRCCLSYLLYWYSKRFCSVKNILAKSLCHSAAASNILEAFQKETFSPVTSEKCSSHDFFSGFFLVRHDSMNTHNRCPARRQCFVIVRLVYLLRAACQYCATAGVNKYSGMSMQWSRNIDMCPKGSAYR